MIRKGLWLLVMFVPGGAAWGQASQLEEFLAPHQHPITFSNGVPGGEGLDVLFEGIEASHFVLFGERHFTHEIPSFLAALIPHLVGNGFDRLAIETGPIGARALAGSLDRGSSTPEFGVPFYLTEEETAFVRTFLLAGDDPGRLWGLDHEYLFGMRTALTALLNFAQSPAARDGIRLLLEEGNAQYEAFLQTGRYSVLPFFAMSPSTLETLAASLDSPHARAAIRHLQQAMEVHRSRDGYFKTRRRAEIMQSNVLQYLLADYARTEAVPKVIVKLGANHTQRGENDQGHPDVGAFVASLAAGIGSSSLHVAIYQKSGRTVDWLPETARTGDTIPPVEGHKYSYPPVLLALASDDDWTLFDLRPLREFLWRQRWVDEADRETWVMNIPPALKRLVDAQDLVIIFPESTPQTRTR